MKTNALTTNRILASIAGWVRCPVAEGESVDETNGRLERLKKLYPWSDIRMEFTKDWEWRLLPKLRSSLVRGWRVIILLTVGIRRGFQDTVNAAPILVVGALHQPVSSETCAASIELLPSALVDVLGNKV